MGGGGGDEGYEQRQRETEAKKQRAREQLNVLFGAGPVTSGSAGAQGTAPAVAMPTREAFTRPGQKRFEGNDETGINGSMFDEGDTFFDQAGYDAAMGKANAGIEMGKSAEANRGARDSLYQTVRDNAFTAGKRRLDENQADAARRLKFELFATGQAGGSGDIDQNALLKRTYNSGLMDLGAKADAAKAQFRGDDENTRLQLLQSIDAGMDEGSALSSAAQRMQVAADRASADASGTALGNVFDTAGLMYEQSQASRGRQAGQDWWNTYSSGGRRGGNNPTGVTTRLPGE
jgi:hypothetical protein